MVEDIDVVDNILNEDDEIDVIDVIDVVDNILSDDDIR